MLEDDYLIHDEDEFTDYSELSRFRALDFNKDKSDRWEKVPDFFDDYKTEDQLHLEDEDESTS